MRTKPEKCVKGDRWGVKGRSKEGECSGRGSLASGLTRKQQTSHRKRKGFKETEMLSSAPKTRRIREGSCRKTKGASKLFWSSGLGGEGGKKGRICLVDRGGGGSRTGIKDEGLKDRTRKKEGLGRFQKAHGLKTQ